MKKLLASCILTLGLAFTAVAQDADAKKKSSTKYVVGMTGVTWAGCKKSVSSAFKTLAGVSKVEIGKGETPGTQKVVLVSSSSDLTKDLAIKSLGDDAKTFQVKTFGKEEAGVTYVVSMTGVTWAGCKKDVRAAFKQLDGVSKIEIAAGKEAGTQKVTVVSSSAELTKKAAIKSLGDKASRYVVKKFKKS